jgi:hypothetical protein
MTNPPGPQDQDPSVWARPGSPSSAAQPAAPAESATTSTPPASGAPRADGSHEAPAQPHRPPTAPDYSAAPRYHAVPHHYAAPQHDTAPRYDQPPWQGIVAPVKSKRRFLRDPLSVVFTFVIVVALLGAGVIGAEIYARKRANSVVAAAAECEVQDKVNVSIGIGPSPFLLQHFNGRYNNISIHTAGNQIRGGKGMKADISLSNLTLEANANSEGTIGAVDAIITWTSNGIRETVQDEVPLGERLIDNVKTSPATGTIELSGPLGLGSITLKPRIAGRGVALEIVKLTAMRAIVSHETAQHALDSVTSRLTNDYPLGVRADSVQVTNDGVVTHFSARNASIPTDVDPCFAHM